MKIRTLIIPILLSYATLGHSQTKLAHWLLEENLDAQTETDVKASKIELKGLVLSEHDVVKSFVKNKGIAIAPTAEGTNWTFTPKKSSIGSPFVDNQYIQFTLQPEKNKSLNIKSIDLNSVMVASSAGRVTVVYSKDAEFKKPENITAVVMPNILEPKQPVITPNMGTPQNPVKLTSVGSGLTNAFNSAFSFVLNEDKGINVDDNETLYVRIYINAIIKAPKYIMLRNVVANGELINKKSSNKKKN